ncbi:PDDEXK nuclease domain-containing protein [Rhodococcus opacus]|uniref:PDDEXK nuclease domain-containing protein n=1 Tax=Rhodococcus opacus TaxID=37919 RepID=UPI00146BAC34|nr:PDDEXK nuclease domain-containing protein [Rhodococcus opacus]MDJ0419664.1 PDDEXK nuclease domain-containing protein [Rhodococcus opacus]MDV7088177.1 PDDEXK nuclease domain-containing protein [Rhodococcus opacus]WKN52545.1 PDDEXK nuclease domain-containing protein [Rhodococcus opacus]
MSSPVPTDYAATLESIKRLVHEARYIAQRRVNTELLKLYWQIGATIIERQKTAPWGSKVLSRLSADLRTEFPGAKGFSSANLKYMRRFAEAWPDQEAIGQRPVGQLPWGHVIELLEKLDDAELRDWYSAKDIAHGWSRPVLAHQIKTHLHLREGAAPSNFPHALERTDSELAQQITKDPFTLEFLAIDGDAAERQLEDRLVERIIDTLRELGPGFAFVGRQVHFDVEGDEFFVDLLFFHVEQLRYVVIELKTTKFDPRDAGQLGFYVALVEDRLRRPQHHPTVGMLLVADKNESVVRYALAGTTQPIAVSRYDLSPAEQAALPAEDALTRAVALELDDHTPQSTQPHREHSSRGGSGV